jgi:hypothetical protein
MGAFVGTRYQAPNVHSIAQQTIEEILMHPGYMFKKGVTLAAGYPHVMVGDVLARITASGKYRRYTPCAVKTGATSATVSLKDVVTGLSIESPFIAGELVSVGADAGNTILSVDNVNGRITLAGSITFVTDEAVILTTPDGSDVAAGIAARPIFSGLYDPGLMNLNYLLDVDYLLDVIFQGILKKAKLRGLDAGAITDLALQTITAIVENGTDAAVIR